jgi:membrane protease YdiL (CAAX protease family)
MTAPVPPVPASTTILELPYHRLYRAQPTYRWWRPLVAIVMTVVFFFAVSFAVATPVLIVLFATGAIDLNNPAGLSQEALLDLLAPDMARPWTLLFGLGSIILVLPLVPLALRIAGIRPTGVRVSILHSVLFRLRWRWLFLTLGLSAMVWIVSVVVQLGIGVAGGEAIGQFTTDPSTYVISILIVLALVPTQAATEEYLYRGVLLQSVGAWLRWAPFGIVISAVLFALSHAYDGWGLLQVGLMGIGFAVVAVRTGGLEAGIAFHTVNNVGSFALSGTGAFGPTGVTAETGGPWAVVGQLFTIAIWVAVIEVFARRQKVERLSRIAVPSTDRGMVRPDGS